MATRADEERLSFRIEQHGDRFPVGLVVLPDLTRRVGRAVEIEGVEEPVLEHDPVSTPEHSPVHRGQCRVSRVGARVAIERGRAIDALAQTLVVVTGDEIRVGQVAVDLLRLKALVRMKDEDRRVAR